jgi:hypothetical protein
VRASRDLRPAPFSPAFVRWILSDPRCVGLSVYKREVVGDGKWPAYITSSGDRIADQEVSR